MSKRKSPQARELARAYSVRKRELLQARKRARIVKSSARVVFGGAR